MGIIAYFLKLMNGSHRPIVQMLRRLCLKAKLFDPTLSEYDFERLVSSATDERVAKLELEAIAEYGDMNLPPNLPLTVKKTIYSKTLACAGFCLSTL